MPIEVYSDPEDVMQQDHEEAVKAHVREELEAALQVLRKYRHLHFACEVLGNERDEPSANTRAMAEDEVRG